MKHYRKLRSVNTFPLLVLATSLVFYCNQISATNYYAVASGTWMPGFSTSVIFNNTGCGKPVMANQVPLQGDQIEVCSGDTLTIITNGSIGNLLIDTNAVVILNPGITLAIYGMYTNYGQIYGGGKVVQYFSNTSAVNQWTAPAGVTSVDIEAWGGGGGGGSAGAVAGWAGAGGGSGGAHAISSGVAVTPGATYSLTIGSGGKGGSASSGGNDGAAGTDSWFSNTSTAGISNQPANSSQGAIAKSGLGGKKPVVLNKGGTGATPMLHLWDNIAGGSYGTAIYIGGYGATGDPFGFGGGGGSSGGPSDDGKYSASGTMDQRGGIVTGGGNGGYGGWTRTSGRRGAIPGGAGGGSGSYGIRSIPTPPYNDTVFFAGGDGAGGQIGIGWSTSGNAPAGCIPPSFTSCPGNIYEIECRGLSRSFSYTSIASGNPTYYYGFSDWSSSSYGKGTGSGSSFNYGTTGVAIVASNACGTATCNFRIDLLDPGPTVNRPYSPFIFNVNPSTCTYIAKGIDLDYTVYSPCNNYYFRNDFNNSSTLSGTQLPVGTTHIIWTLYSTFGWWVEFYSLDVTVIGDRNITAGASAGGNITPAGLMTMNCGSDTSFTITPNPCYHIADILVDGISVGAVASYTFTNITSNHTISASFAQDTFLIDVIQSNGGNISPSPNYVPCGSNQRLSIAPDPCFGIDNVYVNGSAIGAVSNYTFSNVTTPQSITATFTPLTYSITALPASNGVISPAAVTTVNCGSNQIFAITADSCYRILDVKVDGLSVGAVSTYTFSNVTANHTISATFTPITYNINVIQTVNGTISPGTITVGCNSNQTFTITPDACYHIVDVTVDGISVGAVSSYSFSNINADHTITAQYAVDLYSITVMQNANGTISPSSTTSACGTDQTFSITPNACYMIADVLVDNVSVGALSSYTFNNVQTNHLISPKFIIDPSQLSSAASGITSDAPGNSLCSGGNVTLTIIGGTLGNSGSWTWHEGSCGNAAVIGTGNSITITQPAVGIHDYYVRAEGTCNTTACVQISITVHALPATPLINASGPTTFCQGNSVDLSSSGGVLYQWYENGISINGATSNSISGINHSGNFSVTIVADANGCSDNSVSAPVNVTVKSLPLVTVTAPVKVCVGTSYTVSAKGASNYSWKPSTYTGNTFDFTPSVAGKDNYTVTGTDNNNCSNTASTSVIVIPLPALVAYTNSSTISGGQQANLFTSSQSVQYEWSPSFGLSCITCENPIASPAHTTVSTVTITDDNGCVNSDTVGLNVDETVTLYIPSAFTPNGNNPIFKAEGIGISEVELNIFNRYGEMVFQSNDLDVGWDGTYHGATVTEDVYVWMVRAISFKGEAITRTGSVNVMQ